MTRRPARPPRQVTLYDYIRFTHFEAVERAKGLAARWGTLEGLVDAHSFRGVRASRHVIVMLSPRYR